MLNKLTVSELAELSKFSKAYISQVKNGKRPPFAKLIEALSHQLNKEKSDKDYFRLFIQSRESMGVSPKTLDFYVDRLCKFINEVDYLRATSKDIEHHLKSIPANHNGLATRHASFRAIKTFYIWLNEQHGIRNPIQGMPSPILGKPILPSLTSEQVKYLIDVVENIRDKAIIALLTESGLRRSELTGVKDTDIDGDNHTIREESLVKVEKRRMLHLVRSQRVI